MLAHCRDQHSDSVLENPCILTHDIAKPSLNNYIISAFQVLLLLHTKVCVATGNIFHSIRLLGGADEATNYHFTLDIKRNDLLISKPGSVAPQGCLAIQEDTSLSMNTNSLLSILEGFDSTTFIVTLKRKVSDAADQLAKMVEKCGKCKLEVTMFLYRDEKGWRCKRCVPAKRACIKQAEGCTYTDINNKCTKHEFNFCQQRTQCNICNARISRGSLSAHYGSVHQDITYSAGSTWQVTQTKGRRCLVSSAAGSAVCFYRLDDLEFALRVRIPVLSERLSEFRCKLQLTDPATEHTRIFTPDAQYDMEYDWGIVVKKEMFQSWNVVFDVSVDIINI